MIQFNLLPDVKTEFLKAKRTQRIASLFAFAAAAGSLSILVALYLYVGGVQKRHITNLDSDIKRYNNQLQGTKDLNKILTIQNQLNQVGGLHDSKPVSTRLFGYITALTPATASISKLEIDFVTKNLTISGDADNLSTVNKYADTLKFTKYKTSAPGSAETEAFTYVVLTDFIRDSRTTTYKISASFVPEIFDSANDVSLVVPKIVSTRSETEKPAALFSK